jgi:hypothetical protein
MPAKLVNDGRSSWTSNGQIGQLPVSPSIKSREEFHGRIHSGSELDVS